MNYDDYDATGLAELVSKGEASAEELLEEAIIRTERVNGELNAVVLKHYDEARAAASSLPDGPLKGVPFLLKDLHVTLTGTPTTYGSSYFKKTASAATKDATLTQRYKAAGLSIFGKTNSPELGLAGTTEPRAYGPTRNPWDTSCSTGGSSGGAAAAVASGVTPAAHASDGGGSIRIPAANCGLVGFKPTRGRTPMGPDRGEGWAGWSISHVVTRTVRDSALFLDVTSGPEAGAPYEAPRFEGKYVEEAEREPGKLKIGMNVKRMDGTKAEAEVCAALEEAAKLCEGLGHEVEEATPDLGTYEEFAGVQAVVIGANVLLALEAREEESGVGWEGEVERVTAFFASMGRDRLAKEYPRAVNYAHGLGRKMAAYHESYDVYLCPTLGAAPWSLGDIDMMATDMTAYAEASRVRIPYTGAFNMTGQPSVSLPLGWTSGGMPIGVMFTGRYGEDDVLYRLSGQLEGAAPWADKRPRIHVRDAS